MPAMSRVCLIAIACAAALSVLGSAWPAAAQMPTPTGTGPSAVIPPAGRPRIDINPRPVYRRCASWYVIQYRPSGTVLFPEKHCWWQRG
ncbi:MAG: hypothetical protein WB677_15100 [Xanthobacteraceae bacterium]